MWFGERERELGKREREISEKAECLFLTAFVCALLSCSIIMRNILVALFI